MVADSGQTRPVDWDAIGLQSGDRAAVLAPHPDDFDAVGVTMDRIRRAGGAISVAVLSSGASGVEDSFVTPPTPAEKARVREAEQRQSCRFFGLDDEDLVFLRLPEDEGGHLIEDANAEDAIERWLVAQSPRFVFLPHGDDTNLGHRRTWSLFSRIARRRTVCEAAFLNQDPKTIRMRVDVFTPFDEAAAAWKAELLRFHQSQHQRNLRTRGYGFDRRILEVNRRTARDLGLAEPYAEAFERRVIGG